MNDTLGYAGRRVLLSGAASGIGRATAELLVELGAEVHALDRAPITVSGLASTTECDVTDPSAIARAVDRVGAVLSGLFSCAGLAIGPRPADAMLVNFVGLRELTDRTVDYMVEGAAIVSMGSVAGYGWRRDAALEALVETSGFESGRDWCDANVAAFEPDPYAASKRAVNLWTRRVAADLMSRGIRINCVNAGPVETPLFEPFREIFGEELLDAFPIGRYAEAAEIAAALVWLNSPRASYVTGVGLDVDGGHAARHGAD